MQSGTTSVWTATCTMPGCSALDSDLQADVCVIGGGIAGLTTAYLLSLENKQVVLLEKAELDSGESARTTAQINTAHDDNWQEMLHIHGRENILLCADSYMRALQTISTIIKREKIECGFEWVDAYLFAGARHGLSYLREELEVIKGLGLDVSWVDRAPVTSFDSGPCLLYKNQAQFHPLQYYTGLVHAIMARGGKIFCNTRAIEIKGGREAHVQTDRGFAIHANALVVATNTPVNDRLVMHTKLAAYRSYVIAARVPLHTVPHVQFWDTEDPYHYVRLYTSAEHGADDGFQGKGYDLLIIGGEDHKTGQNTDASKRLNRLEDWARARFPIEEVELRWSGQITETLDGMPYAGRNAADDENVYIITGDSGTGMTHGTLGAILVSDLICGRQNKWQQLYDPARKLVLTLPRFLQENWNVAVQYTDWASGGDVESSESIAPDCGAIMRDGVAKIAVYRDPKGELHRCSAVCTHLGGIVRWNALEKSWDCPCHGARYDPYGKVINGPANKDLGPIVDASSPKSRSKSRSENGSAAAAKP